VLFENQPDLIEGFKQFLPTENPLQNQEDKPQSPGSNRQQKVRALFAEYNENPTSLSELSSKLKELAEEDPALLKLLDQYGPYASGSGRKEVALNPL